MSKLEDTIDLTLIEDNITEVLKGDDESHPIMIESEENSISLDSEIELILENLKGKFLNKTIAFYMNKYR